MKKLTYIFLSLLVLAGCTGTSRQPQLVTMDSLLLSRPDSALTLLRGMTFTDKADRMYHYLLLADACNKCYDTLPSDSILQEVTDYYDRHGSANEQVRAHYLLGCAYRDMGEAPMALQCYQQAIECADTLSEDCDFAQLSRVYSQMGEIYFQQNLFHYQLHYSQFSTSFAYKGNDTLAAITNYATDATAYDLLGELDSMIIVSVNAYNQFRKLGYNDYAAATIGLAVSPLLRKGETDLAKKYMDIYESRSGFFDEKGNIEPGREIYYYDKGEYYAAINKLDSAIFYFRKELSTGKDYANQNAGARGLAKVYLQIHLPDSAAKYALYSYEMNDSLYAQMTTNKVAQLQAMYDYSRHQEMARKAEQKAERAKTGIVAILAVGLVVLAIGAFFYQQYRNKKKAEIQQLNNDYGRALLEYNKLSAELERMKQQDGSLILDKQQEVEELKARLQAYQATLQTNGTSQQLSVFQESSIMQTFRTKSRVSPQTSLPTETEWKRLVSQFSRSLPYAYAALGRDVILSTNELRVCILLLSGFKIADVAVLLDTSPQSITNLKARANNKLFGESSASTLERNLMNTVGLA